MECVGGGFERPALESAQKIPAETPTRQEAYSKLKPQVVCSHVSSQLLILRYAIPSFAAPPPNGEGQKTWPIPFFKWKTSSSATAMSKPFAASASTWKKEKFSVCSGRTAPAKPPP